MSALTLRQIRELLKGAPPMAAYYQTLAKVNDDKQMRRRKAKRVQS